MLSAADTIRSSLHHNEPPRAYRSSLYHNEPPPSYLCSQFTSGLSFSRFKQRDEHGGLNLNLSSINRVLNLSTGNVGLFQWVKSIMLTFVENNSVDLPKTGTAFSFCTFLPGQFTLDEVNFTSSSEGNFVRVFVYKKQVGGICEVITENGETLTLTEEPFRFAEVDGGLYCRLVESRIPFSVDDISTSLQEKDFKNVKPVVDLANYGAFHLKIGQKHIICKIDQQKVLEFPPPDFVLPLLTVVLIGVFAKGTSKSPVSLVVVTKGSVAIGIIDKGFTT
ncbi:hypothetical protein L2E82_30001 [Cichorium intybus]|uniref:Uncharacterized protein n=1 Tax=Cichorium intybus TaxID=13427 RepID=A0ACB9CZ59_CICIN|nr:hypothetical protein L2E82_30001 [Cichorium intybus]